MAAGLVPEERVDSRIPRTQPLRCLTMVVKWRLPTIRISSGGFSARPNGLRHHCPQPAEVTLTLFPMEIQAAVPSPERISFRREGQEKPQLLLS